MNRDVFFHYRKVLFHKRKPETFYECIKED